ncbi:glycosyltransferase family 39 protein [Candidatus Microgenomates bacterium]|nr:glycosyltransferase family 39 protein [Candidatus Microgenomates bacterium]
MRKNILISLLLGTIFFVVCFWSLKDYGISWDSATHFKRGQAYIHYYLTGKTDYKDIVGRKSFYQNDIQDGKFWLKDTHGHPPVNDVLSSFFNFILYQKLGIVGDIESYNLFIILVSSLLVSAVVYYCIETFGVVTAIVSGVLLSTYPLFWSESHFNIKDPIEASFFTITILSLTRILKTKNPKWIIMFFIFWGLSIGVKFNALFIPVIILPYLFFNRKDFVKILKKHYLYILIGILITIAIFILSWPALWQGNLILNILDVFKFYKEIGTNYNYQPTNFYFLGANTYSLQWILFTTPIVTLVLFVLGIFNLIRNWKKNSYLSLLLLLWFFIPIIRVSLPNSSIYGGARQIMEYIPVMAIIAAIGVNQIVNKIKNNKPLVKLIILSIVLVSSLLPIINYHPNENVYFNFLIGGLKGAKQVSFPSWGNSFGSAYKQGIDWINTNATKGSKLTLLQGELINAPKIWLRVDIDYKKENYSGSDKKGEYIMELTFNDTVKLPKESWDYVEFSLIPVYEEKVDGVAILKIWKNDNEHNLK